MEYVIAYIVYDLPNGFSRRISARARGHHSSTVTCYCQLQRTVGTSAETLIVRAAIVGTLTHTFSSAEPVCRDFDPDIRRPIWKICRDSGSDLLTDKHRSLTRRRAPTT
jgi:hypothetical protein